MLHEGTPPLYRGSGGTPSLSHPRTVRKAMARFEVCLLTLLGNLCGRNVGIVGGSPADSCMCAFGTAGWTAERRKCQLGVERSLPFG